MLGFLSNLRDMKSALTSGMVLIFTIWLIFWNEVGAVAPDESVAGNVRQLTEYIGPIATLGLVSFCAYFLGLVLSADRVLFTALRFVDRVFSSNLRILRLGIGGLPPFFQSVRLWEFVYNKVQQAGQYSPDSAIPGLRDIDHQEFARVMASTKLRASSFSNRQNRDPHFTGATDRLVQSMQSDVDLLAVQLGHKQEKAYDRFDKARSEAEFRAGLVLPLGFFLAVLTTRITQEGAPWWCVALLVGCGLGALIVLARKAQYKTRESQEEVINAILLGEIQIDRIQELQSIISSGRRAALPDGFVSDKTSAR